MPQPDSLISYATVTQIVGAASGLDSGSKWEPIAIQAVAVIISAFAAYVATKKNSKKPTPKKPENHENP